MVEEINIRKLMELYLDTIDKCGMYLLNSDNEVIEYNVFEEFDIGVVSFLHDDNLIRLKKAEIINDKILAKSCLLRDLVMKLQNGDKWNVGAVKNSTEWREILELADEIKVMIQNMKE